MPSDIQVGIPYDAELCTLIALVSIRTNLLINNGVEMTTTRVSEYLLVFFFGLILFNCDYDYV